MAATELDDPRLGGAPDRPPVDPGGDRPPWRPWTAPAALVLGLIAAMILGAIVDAASVAGGSGAQSSTADLVATFIQDGCFIGAALYFAWIARRPTPGQFGLRLPRFWPAVGAVAAGYAVFYAATTAWLSGLNLHESQNLPQQLGAGNGTASLVAVTVLVCLIAPIAEEFLFRGYMFTALRGWAGRWGASVIVGVLFGAVHGLSSPAGFLLPLALFGVILCVVYWTTNSLLPCMALHALNNGLAFGGTENWTWQIAIVVAGSWAILALGVVWTRRLGAAPRAA